VVARFMPRYFAHGITAPGQAESHAERSTS